VATSTVVQIPVGPDGIVEGDLVRPDGARVVVVFAHGSGSSRHSPRNQQVAAALHARALATLMMDLLTAAEEAVDLRTREYRFDIPRLATRLVAAIDWLAGTPGGAELPVGTFGASTGAAAALIAAAERPDRVRAVVARGGRPDLAGPALSRVRAPTLLIVGERDPIVIDLNREAARQLTAPHEIVVVPGATHLFEEPGALDEVSRLACDWFVREVADRVTRRPAPRR
jgi:dienelactone hydrolase